jgi:tRNA pseudouridine13 synthase
MPRPDLTPPQYTPDLPGTGGRIKANPDDFQVEEIPSYLPSGSGDHIYLWLEKRGVGSEQLAKGIARRLGVHVGEIGMAGQKDRHAVTRQWISVPREAEAKIERLNGEGLTVLQVSRHTNKLKPGHLRGNRFTILIRDADRAHAESAEAVLKRIRDKGLPNYYGPQRFGHGGETAITGFRCLTGQQRQRLRPYLFKFALSAAQSVLFNEVLARRFRDGYVHSVLAGDVLMKWPAGGIFVCTDPAADQLRFDTREIVTGGPMFGSRTYPAQGVVAEREAEVLRDFELTPAVFQRFGKLASGTRRHNLIYIDDLTSHWEPEGFRLTFTLPAGSYATVLLREVMKVDVDSAEAPDDGDGDE